MNQSSAGATGSLGNQSRAVDIDAPHLRHVSSTQMHHCCGVNHIGGTIHGVLEGLFALEGASHRFEAKAVECSSASLAMLSNQPPNAQAPVKKQPSDIVADQSRDASHEAIDFMRRSLLPE